MTSMGPQTAKSHFGHTPHPNVPGPKVSEAPTGPTTATEGANCSTSEGAAIAVGVRFGNKTCCQGSGNQIRSSSVWDQADEEAAFCGGPSEGLGHRCDPDRRRRRFARSSFTWSDQDGVAGPKDEPPLPGS